MEQIERALSTILRAPTPTRRWRAYEQYRDSGVEWLGEIPGHWGIRRLKFLAPLKYGGSLPSDARQEGEVVVFGSNGPVGFHAYANTSESVLIIGRKGSFGKICFSEEACFAIDTTYFVDAVSTQSNIRWLFYALSLLNLDKISMDSAIPGLSREFAHEQRLTLPSLPEQRAIAAFLDRETARIDALIAKKEQLLALLQEKRAALISRAVTRGLKPDAPLKDSGVDWLGMVPAHWEVKRLKFIADVLPGVAKGRDLGERDTVELPYLRVANVQDGYLDLSEVATITVGVDEAKRYSLQAGDVLMNEGGDSDKLGRGYVWEGDISPCLHQNHVFAVRPHEGVDSYWINLITSTSYAKYYFITKSKQSTNLASISSTNLMELPVLCPPKIEQDAIQRHIGSETARIDLLISRICEGIEKIKEYRTALISAAVTGKIDVRGEVGTVMDMAEGAREDVAD